MPAWHPSARRKGLEAEGGRWWVLCVGAPQSTRGCATRQGEAFVLTLTGLRHLRLTELIKVKTVSFPPDFPVSLKILMGSQSPPSPLEGFT